MATNAKRHEARTNGIATLRKTAILVKPGKAPADTIEAIKTDAERLKARLLIVSPKVERDGVPIEASPELDQVMMELCDVNASIKMLETRKSVLEADLKTAIGDACEIRGTVGRYCAEPMSASIVVKAASVRHILRQ